MVQAEGWNAGRNIFLHTFILIMGMFLMEEGRLDQRGRYVLALVDVNGNFGVIVL